MRDIVTDLSVLACPAEPFKFLTESGIDKECFSSTEQEETLVDWIAIQFPKMLKAMQEIDAL